MKKDPVTSAGNLSDKLLAGSTTLQLQIWVSIYNNSNGQYAKFGRRENVGKSRNL